MLTGDEIRSNGNAYATGCNLGNNKKRFLSNLGYCPQFDGIVGVLTGKEMVELFARLRGVESVSSESKKWLTKVGKFYVCINNLLVSKSFLFEHFSILQV